MTQASAPFKLLSDMNPHEAFDLTLKTFKIKAVDVANKSGRSESYISQFRHGSKDIAASAMVEIVRALPLPAQMYFWGLCMSVEINQTPKVVV